MRVVFIVLFALGISVLVVTLVVATVDQRIDTIVKKQKFNSRPVIKQDKEQEAADSKFCAPCFGPHFSFDGKIKLFGIGPGIGF